jgi:uncharacterized membrane protein YccC
MRAKAGTVVDSSVGMDTNTPTVEMSLDALSEAVGKSADDLRAVRDTIDRARADIAARNTSVSREVVAAAARAVNHLKHVDEALRDVLQGLAERD